MVVLDEYFRELGYLCRSGAQSQFVGSFFCERDSLRRSGVATAQGNALGKNHPPCQFALKGRWSPINPTGISHQKGHWRLGGAQSQFVGSFFWKKRFQA